MDLRLLRYFVATVDAGSANRAAAALHVTQPVLSRQLRLLERTLGMELFDRRGGRLRLSKAGERFLPHARDLVDRADLVGRAAAGIAAGSLAEVHLAVPTTTLTDVVAPFLATLGPDDPVPMVRQLDPGGAGAALAAGADLAVVTRPPSWELASRMLAELPMWAYVPPSHPSTGSGSVSLADLVSRPLVLLTEGFRPRQLLDAAVDAAGLGYGPVLECGNAQVAQALAAAGRGIAVVSDDPRFDLVPLRILAPTGPLTISLYAAWEPGHHAAVVLAGLARRLSAFCVDRYGAAVLPPS